MISGKTAARPSGRRSLLLILFFLVAWSRPAVLPTAAADFDVFEATIEDINRAFDEKRLTAEQLVRHYLARIEAFEDKGPGINALVTVNPEALARARAQDRERTEKGPRRARPGV